MQRSQIYIIDISNIFSAYQNVERIKLLLKSLNSFGLASGHHAANFGMLTEKYERLHMLGQELINTPLIPENMWPANVGKLGNLFSQFIVALNDFDKTRRGLLNELNKFDLKNEIDKKAASALENYYPEPLFGLTGVCSGLGTWWGYTMSEKNESVFYGITDEISQCLDMNNRIDLEKMHQHEMALMKYSAHIRWLHAPGDVVEGIEQNDLTYITEVFKLEYIFNPDDNIKLDVMDEKKIADMLRILPEERLIKIGEAGHDVSVYKRGNEFFYFDSNAPNGRAVQTSEPDMITQMIVNSYSQSQWFGGYLKMNIFVNPENEKKVMDKDRVKWIEFMKSCNYNSKDSALQTAARCVGAMNLETMCAITNTSDMEKLNAIIKNENILSTAFECKNYQFIKAMMDLERMTVGKLIMHGKLELLNQICEDYFSPSVFSSSINLKPAEDLICHILKCSDDLTINKFLHSMLEKSVTAAVAMQNEAKEAKLILTLLASHDEGLKNKLVVIAGTHGSSEAKFFSKTSPVVSVAREILVNIENDKTITQTLRS